MFITTARRRATRILLAALLLGAVAATGPSAGAATGEVRIAAYTIYEGLDRPTVNVTFDDPFPDPLIEVENYVIRLRPMLAGEEQLPSFRDVTDIEEDGKYRTSFTDIAPGIYEVEIEATTNFGPVVRTSVVDVHGPPTVDAVTETESGLRIEWAYPIGPPPDVDVVVIDSLGILFSETLPGSSTSVVAPMPVPGETVEIIVTAVYENNHPLSDTPEPLSSESAFHTRAETPPPPAPDPVDETPPVVEIVDPGPVSRFGSTVPFLYSCTDDVAVASCDAELADGEGIPVDVRGNRRYDVTATDTSGNTTTKSITIRIDWSLPEPYGGVTGVEGTVARYYVATFGRVPDGPGFAYWTELLAADPANATPVANFFVTSPEFQLTYGDLDDEAFVDTIYRNVLGRAPEGAGRDYWLGELAAGADRGIVMSAFSDSAEHMLITGTG